jgi:adenosylcobyric acid synthase
MKGYEIHLGVTQGEALAQPAVYLADNQPDGVISSDGQILATYCHGVFEHPEDLTSLLSWAGLSEQQPVDFAARREADLDRLADAVEAALDWEKLAEYLPMPAV